MNQPLAHPIIVSPGTRDWMQDRLMEARGILVDAPRHAESLVLLAARVVVGQTDSASECSEAVDMLRKLDRRSLLTITAAAFPNGGAV